MTAAPTNIDTAHDWKHLGACYGHPHPDMWFPESASRTAAIPAMRVCAECPVTRTCYEYALKLRIPYGIWGGLRQTQRPHGMGYRGNSR